MPTFKGVNWIDYYQEHAHGRWQVIDEANAEYTNDGGKTWRKCVRLEKEPWWDERSSADKGCALVVCWNGARGSVPFEDIRDL